MISNILCNVGNNKLNWFVNVKHMLARYGTEKARTHMSILQEWFFSVILANDYVVGHIGRINGGLNICTHNPSD